MESEMQELRRYLTDDRDEKHRNELIIFQGGNGDWYVGVGEEGTWPMRNFVRLCTSGGASSACPGLTRAIAAAYRAMPPSTEEKEKSPN